MIQKRSLFILSLAVFSTMVGNSMVVPFLPLHVQQFGVGGFGAGLLFSVHAATRTLLLPLIGKASDRWGRKGFLLVGFLFYILASVAYLPAGSLTAFILIMVLQGTATAVVHPVAMAYVGDLAPAGEEGAYSGYINTALLGGIASGPLLGGMTKDLFNMQANFLAMGSLSLFSLLLILSFLPGVQGSRTTAHTSASSFWGVLSCRPIVGAAFFRLGYALTNTLTWVFLPLLAFHLLPLRTTQIGFLISVNILASTLLQAPCGRLADRVSRARLIGIGGLVGALALGVFPLSASFWHLLLLNLLVGTAYGLAFPAHVALAMENARGYGMGTVMSLLLMAHSSGMMVGPLLFGFIADHYTLGGAFYSGGLTGALVTGVCYILTSVPASEPKSAKEVEKEPAVAD